ncbi:COG4223 family protein [Methyloligella solikamskensis]|uniref:COG4223 family protein n=1 Tax=Methyloligella solikamskensis TaxID=1177756 RepID=A0ABW3J723_9HYPH
MADPFGDKNKDADADKRPTQTIEGTAEEVPSENESAETQSAGTEQDSAASEEMPETEASSAESSDSASDEASSDEGDGSSEESQTDEDEAVAAPPPARSGGGFLSHVFAGVIGGVIGVVALFLAVTYYPSLVTKTTPELEARLDALESRNPDAEVSQDDLFSLQDRVAKLESTIDSMADQAKNGGSVADAAAVSQQIGEAEKRLESKIDQRLADLPKAESQASDSSAADAQKIASLSQEMDSLKSEVASLSQAQAKENAGNTVDESDLEAVKERVSKLETELPNISSAVEKTSNEARSAALTASLADLRTAVLSGGPYEAELDDFKGIAPASTGLSPLPAHAADGIATMPELITAFEPARDNALSTEVEPAEEGFFDTLLSSASSVVTVRRLDGAGKGDSTEAILTRARSALDEGDLDKAIDEVESLKPEPKDAMEDWLAAAKARTGAQATLKRLAANDLAQSSDASPQADAPAASGL